MKHYNGPHLNADVILVNGDSVSKVSLSSTLLLANNASQPIRTGCESDPACLLGGL